MVRQQPFVSIVIPNYKRCDELIRALKTVLNQTFSDFEIIVVDDCSPNFHQIHDEIQSLNDSRITVLKNETNLGGGYSRNVGIERSKGKFIAFLDSDDEWQIGKLEKQISLLKKYNYDNVVVYCKSKIIYRTTPMYLPLRPIEEDEKICDYLFVNNGFMQTSSILADANLVKKVKFNPLLRRHQDYDFLLRIDVENVKYLYIEEPLVVIHWEGERNYQGKGWRPDLTYNFALQYRNYFSNKSYNNFLFMNLVNSSAVCYSKLASLKYLLNINPLYVKPINILKYMKNLARITYER